MVEDNNICSRIFKTIDNNFIYNPYQKKIIGNSYMKKIENNTKTIKTITDTYLYLYNNKIGQILDREFRRFGKNLRYYLSTVDSMSIETELKQYEYYFNFYGAKIVTYFEKGSDHHTTPQKMYNETKGKVKNGADYDSLSLGYYNVSGAGILIEYNNFMYQNYEKELVKDNKEPFHYVFYTPKFKPSLKLKGLGEVDIDNYNNKLIKFSELSLAKYYKVTDDDIFKFYTNIFKFQKDI